MLHFSIERRATFVERHVVIRVHDDVVDHRDMREEHPSAAHAFETELVECFLSTALETRIHVLRPHVADEIVACETSQVQHQPQKKSAPPNFDSPSRTLMNGFASHGRASPARVEDAEFV